MSVQAISWVIDNSKAKGGPLLTLLMVANYAGADGTGAWPSIATLAKDTRLTDRAVQMHLRELVKMGELIVEEKKGPHQCNLYTIPMIGGEKISPIGVKRLHQGGENFAPGGENITPLVVKPTSPNPLIEPSIKPSVNHRAVARPFPEDFVITDTMRLWAKKNVPGLNVIAATDEWADAMRSNTTKYRYTDWEAAWRTGMKRALAWGGNGNGSHKQGGPQLQTEKSVRDFRPGLWEATMEKH